MNPFLPSNGKALDNLYNSIDMYHQIILYIHIYLKQNNLTKPTIQKIIFDKFSYIQYDQLR